MLEEEEQGEEEEEELQIKQGLDYKERVLVEMNVSFPKGRGAGRGVRR